MIFSIDIKNGMQACLLEKISIKNEVTRNEILYFTVALNKLKQKLLTVLVRDIDKTFFKFKYKTTY